MNNLIITCVQEITDTTSACPHNNETQSLLFWVGFWVHHRHRHKVMTHCRAGTNSSLTRCIGTHGNQNGCKSTRISCQPSCEGATCLIWHVTASFAVFLFCQPRAKLPPVVGAHWPCGICVRGSGALSDGSHLQQDSQQDNLTRIKAIDCLSDEDQPWAVSRQRPLRWVSMTMTSKVSLSDEDQQGGMSITTSVHDNVLQDECPWQRHPR